MRILRGLFLAGGVCSVVVPVARAKWRGEVLFSLEQWAVEGLFALWVCCLICGGAYLLFRRGRVDGLLHFAWWVGVGLTGGVVGSLLLWVLLGGWGPPVPVFFAVVGGVAGFVVGVARSLPHLPCETS